MGLEIFQSGLAIGRDALHAGDVSTAVDIFQRLAATTPSDPEARYWLASALLAAGDAQAAAGAMDDARILHALPLAAARGADLARCKEDAAYANDIATRLYAQNHVAMSGVVRALALSAGEISADGLLSYGLALQHQGRAEDACQVFRAAAENFPSAQLHQFLLFPQLFCDDGEARYAAEARDWARLYARAPSPAPFGNPARKGRKLRIGYLAPNFAGTQLRQFVRPLFESHDPQAVEVVLYPARAETEAGQWPSSVAIHPIGELSDSQAAALIRRDGIDVLADCWGHTAGSRLPLVALRPAPVQVAWINFVQTTGLEQVDYVLHADADRPIPTEGLFTESIWTIGPVFNVFRPSDGRLPPAPTPAVARGQVTFGSFNHPAKLNDHVLDTWAAILRAAPAGRLLLKYSYFIDPVLQRVTQARFAARGVAPERIVFAGHSTGEAYHQAFAEVDLMLDTWPAPGSTTTLEALSNGVPVLSLDGPEPSLTGAYARAMLEASGLHELVASSPQDFVARALDLTADPARLDALRARVRPGFEGGGCCDAAGLARRLEAPSSQPMPTGPRGSSRTAPGGCRSTPPPAATRPPTTAP